MESEDTNVSPTLVCYGNLTIDDVVLPDGSERPGCVGGDALYATLAARPFDATAQPVAPIGRDLGAGILDAMAAVGLARQGMIKRDVPTLHNRVVYDDAGGREWTLFNEEGDFAALSPFAEDVPAAYRRAPRHLVLAMDLDATASLISDLCGSPDRFVAFDPQEDYIADNRERLLALVGTVNLFMPSEEEVYRLLGHKDWPKAARELASLGPELVIIKQGGQGALLFDSRRDLEFHVPVHPCLAADPSLVIDTTGAGDSFCGGFMAMMATADPETAMLAGSTAASFTVSGYGAAPLFETAPDAIRTRFEDWVRSGGWRGTGTAANPLVWSAP